MAGNNPYIKGPEVTKPTKKFRVTFKNMNKVIEIDPEQIPFGGTGLGGSILDIALNHGIEIDHACGGVAACSTCHVYLTKGEAFCSEAVDSEQDMLDLAPDVRPNSRLSCQCVPNGEGDVEIDIPAWNRNLVREGH